MTTVDQTKHADLVRRRREQLREQGFRPAEIWFKGEHLDQIDELAHQARVSRSKMIEMLMEPVLAARFGESPEYGCDCDLPDGEAPDGCVIDEGRPENCIHARAGMDKASCEHWKPVAMRQG